MSDKEYCRSCDEFAEDLARELHRQDCLSNGNCEMSKTVIAKWVADREKKLQSRVQMLQEKYEGEFIEATEHYQKTRCSTATKILDERIAVLSRVMNDMTVLWEQAKGFRS